jgi:hypothetical protein
MSTNPATDEHSTRPTPKDLNEFSMDGPQTIPSLWDVSEILSRPAPPSNGSRARKNGSTPPVDSQEQPAAPVKRAAKVISELPESDFPSFFFKPY